MRCSPPFVASILLVFSPIVAADGQTPPFQASVAIKKADRVLSSSPVSIDDMVAQVIDGAIEQAKKEIHDPAELKLVVEGMFTGPFTKQDYENVKRTIERIKSSVTDAQCFNRPARLTVIVASAERVQGATIRVRGSYRARCFLRHFPTGSQYSDEAVQHFEKVTVSVDIPGDLAGKVDLHKLRTVKSVIFTIDVLDFDIRPSCFRKKCTTESDMRWIITSLSAKAVNVGRNVLK